MVGRVIVELIDNLREGDEHQEEFLTEDEIIGAWNLKNGDANDVRRYMSNS